MLAGRWKQSLALLAPAILCLVMLFQSVPVRAQDLTEEQVNAAAWSEEQIQARIRELEAERVVRMALMLPEKQSDFLADPQTWLVGLAVLLSLSIFCLAWLLVVMRRWKNQEWQASVIVDWEEPRKPRIKRQVPNDELENGWLNPQASSLTNRDARNDRHEMLTAQMQPVYQFSDSAIDMIEFRKAPPPTIIDDEDQEYDWNPYFDEGISVIEETGALQQAQFWAALDKSEVAIDILEQYYEQDRAPNSWLLLFDLYRKTGQRAKYEIMKRRFKCIFNAQVPDWDEKCLEQSRLKDMPELAQRINRFLSGNSVVSFLEGLLFDNRGGTRRGFEYGVYCDLVKLFDTLCAGGAVQDCESVCQ